jgi:hypothetical protein
VAQQQLCIIYSVGKNAEEFSIIILICDMTIIILFLQAAQVTATFLQQNVHVHACIVLYVMCDMHTCMYERNTCMHVSGQRTQFFQFFCTVLSTVVNCVFFQLQKKCLRMECGPLSDACRFSCRHNLSIGALLI